MVDEKAKSDRTQFICIWAAIAVIFVVFFLPIGSKVIGEGGSAEVRISYTLWDKIAGNGPSEKAELHVDGEKFRHR